MALGDFTTYLKSTIDKHGVDIANALGLASFVDLDDLTNAAKILQSDESAIVWMLDSIDENPIDPLYTVTFSVGAKTTLDPGRYSMMQFVSQVKTTFPIGETIKIYDYTVPSGSTPVYIGTMHIVESGVDAQNYDKESGYRFVSVVARAVRDA